MARTASRAATSSAPLGFQKSRTTTLPEAISRSSGRDGSPASDLASALDAADSTAGAAAAGLTPVDGVAAAAWVGSDAALAAFVVAWAEALDAATAPLALSTAFPRPCMPGAVGGGAAASSLGFSTVNHAAAKTSSAATAIM